MKINTKLIQNEVRNSIWGSSAILPSKETVLQGGLLCAVCCADVTTKAVWNKSKYQGALWEFILTGSLIRQDMSTGPIVARWFTGVANYVQSIWRKEIYAGYCKGGQKQWLEKSQALGENLFVFSKRSFLSNCLLSIHHHHHHHYLHHHQDHHSKTLGKLWKQGPKVWKSWGMRKSALRYCPVDKTWLLHTWTQSNCGYQDKICIISSQLKYSKWIR